MVERKNVITAIANVADSYGEPCRVRAGCSEHDRLLGPAAGAAHAAEFEHANRSIHAACPVGAPRL